MKLFQVLKISAIVTLFASPAYAYLDPGSGSMLLQGLLALVAGLFVFAKNPMAAIQMMVSSFRAKPSDNARDAAQVR